MTSSGDLAAAFGDARTEVIEHEGRKVRSFVRIAVRPGSEIVVTRLTATRRRPQALVLATNDGSLVVADTVADSVSLWTDTSPRRVVLTVDADGPTTVDLWNAWRYGGVTHAWIGNAGVVVQSDPGLYTLQCSDGVGSVDFTDLVVTVGITPP